MKRTLTLFLILVLILSARIQAKGKSFAAKARAASGALFELHGGKRTFICSGTLFAYTENGDGLFATARHCVFDDPDEDSAGGAIGPAEVSFSDNEAGPFYTATIFRISRIDDVAILSLKNAAGQPAVPLGSDATLHSGLTLLNFGFGKNLGKLPITVTTVAAPALAHYPEAMLRAIPTWLHSMAIDGSILPGDSGSGLFDARQHTLVGIAVGKPEGDANIDIAIPVSRLSLLLNDPSVAQDISAKPKGK